MTILWCGGEDIDFPNGYGVSNLNTYYDSAFTRVSLGSVSFSSSISFTPITSGWLHCNFASLYTGYSNHIGLTDSSFKGIYATTSSTNVLIRKYDGTTFSTLATFNCLRDGYTYGVFDLQIINYGASSTINFYLNGVFVGTFSGDCSISGVSNLYRVTIGTLGAHTAASEIIVADEDTRLMRLKTCAPNAAGDTSANWTGAYTDIDEPYLSTVDKIYTTTDNADFQSNLTGMPTGTYRVKAVKSIVSAFDGKGNMGVQLGVKTNGSVSVGTTQTCSGYWTPIENLMTVNPVTGLEWTPAEIEALQLNVRAKVV